MAGVFFASSEDRTVEWNPPIIPIIFISDAPFVISVLFKEPGKVWGASHDDPPRK